MITVNELMTVEPDTVTPDTSLREVLSMMNGVGCRQLPVLEKRELVGIITDRDVRLAVNAPALDPDRMQRIDLMDEMQVRDYMTTDPITATPDMPARRAAELLGLYKVGALPVVDGTALVGIISVTDFLAYIAKEPEPAIEDLRR